MKLQRMASLASLSFPLVFLLLSLSSAAAGGDAATAANAPKYGSKSFSFTDFTDSSLTNLEVRGDASIDNIHGALQLTPDTANDETFRINKSGRVLFNQPFRLWSPPASANATPYVASFSTVFTINTFYDKGNIPGEGLAFLITPLLDAPPPGSDSGFLGLSNATTDGKINGSFVAVELDTLKQDYDIDGNHVGLDIDSVHSVAAESLNKSGISIAVDNDTFYNVWIDYLGAERTISVYMALNSTQKPVSPVLAAPLDLSALRLPETLYLGFAGSTGVNYELNCVLAWNFTVEILPTEHSNKLWLYISLSAAAIVGVAMAVIFLELRRRRQRRVEPDLGIGGLMLWMPREFEYKELAKATSNFDEKRKLGQGGYGVVFHGVLDVTGKGRNKTMTEVAVKKFTRASAKGRQRDFVDELSVINRLRHRNLVRLVGWSHDKGVLLLVYDYLVNGSLDRHLFVPADNSTAVLSWDRRYAIVTGVASALHYLHNEYDGTVLHRDIKSSNILLDAGFNAHLGDFGIARVMEADKTSFIESNGFPGTPGYIAPECFHTARATRESDMFAFGAVVLEIVSGHRAHGSYDGHDSLVQWAWWHHGECQLINVVDGKLERDQFSVDDAERLILLGLACSNPNPSRRPKTGEILQILSRALPPPDVPTEMPVFVWPVAPPTDEGTKSVMGSQVLPMLTSLSQNISADENTQGNGPSSWTI